jgi:hypothetical protein
MKTVAWLVGLAVVAGFGYWFWRVSQRLRARQEAAEARYSNFVASANLPPAAAAALAAAATPAAAAPAPAPARLDIPALTQQKLLLDAAAKAAEANEPALAIQLYARLLARYPDTPHAATARAAVEVQKKKFSKH